jgi:hypothetical protein
VAYRTPREEVGRTGVSWGKLKEREHLENLGMDVRMIIRQTFKKWAVKARTGLIWLRIGASRELLRTWQ